MNSNTILWIYIVLLVAGGLIGYLKAGSKDGNVRQQSCQPAPKQLVVVDQDESDAHGRFGRLMRTHLPAQTRAARPPARPAG